MRDLSHLAVNSMTVTSQEGGNMVHDNSPAMTAPGSSPSTPVPAQETQSDPNLEMGAQRPVGDTGRGQPATSYSPVSMTWKTVPDG